MAGDTGGRWGVLLTRLSASGFGIVNHPTLVFLFQFLLPRHRAASGLPPSLRGHWAQLDKHPRVQDHFSNYFFLRRRGKKKSDFLPSFSVGQLPSFPGAASLRPHRLSPASGQKARPPSSLPHPGAWAASGFFTFPKAGFSSQFSLSDKTELSLSVPASGCCQGGIWGLGTLRVPVSPWLDSQSLSEPHFVIPVFFPCPALPGASCSCLLSGAAHTCLYLYISLVSNYTYVCT